MSILDIIVIVVFLLVFGLIWIFTYIHSNRAPEKAFMSKQEFLKGKEELKKMCSESTYAKISRIYSRSYPAEGMETFSYVYNFYVNGKKYSFIKDEGYHSPIFDYFKKYKIWYNPSNPNICYIDRSFKEVAKRILSTILIMIITLVAFVLLLGLIFYVI